MKNEELLKQIQEQAIHLDWDIAFGGKSKGNMHLVRVNKLAEKLLENEEGDRFVTLASAWLHDSDLTVNKDHHLKSDRLVSEDFLEEIGLSRDIIIKITHCIRAHDGHIKAETKEAHIVHDADTLDKSGPLGVVRHTWKLAHTIPDIQLEKVLEIIPKHLRERKSNLYTPSARLIAFRNTQILEEFVRSEDFDLIIADILKMAKDNFISDQIATEICKKYSNNFTEKLKEQIS